MKRLSRKGRNSMSEPTWRKLTSKERRDLNKIARDLREADCKELYELKSLLMCRAGKLLKKNKPFIVVARDEPYFLNVYKMIRTHEKSKGTWKKECEEDFQIAAQQWFDRA